MAGDPGALEVVSEHRCHGGVQGFYRHLSAATGTVMRFSVFVPAGAGPKRAPTLTYLAGLTCTEETFAIKAGAQRLAAELGLILVAGDTSPRGLGLPGETDAWDFGAGAGFYLDATEAPWSGAYRMESWITRDLPAVVAANFPVDPDRQGVTGHSMGGHGALTLSMRHPGLWRSVSAFAPIASAARCPWGEKAFSGYLGTDRAAWEAHDASLLIARARNQPAAPELLVDQGLADQFLEPQLHPHLLEQACAEAGRRLTMRRHAGYDHGYWFVQSFIADHLRWHSDRL
jgi:S-formylglutathione hydrolase